MDAATARASTSGLPGLPVRTAYLSHALPSVPAVLESLSGDCAADAADGERAVIVLPLLLTPAYHSDTDLPAMLREIRRRLPQLRIRYGAPLGPHPRLQRALERRLSEAGGDAGLAGSWPGKAGVGARLTGPDPGKAGAGARLVTRQDTAIVLAAAGSSRPAANAAVTRLAAQWQSARGWRAVVPAYASAVSPAPGEAVAELQRSGAKRVVVATYLLAPGFFADQVREQSLAAGAGAVSAPLGAAPEVADVVVLRYLQAVRGVTGRRAFAI